MKVLDENGLSCLKSIIKPKVFEKKKDGNLEVRLVRTF